MFTKYLRALLVLLALMAVGHDAPVHGGNKNPGVIPPNAKYKGLTYGEWGAEFWKAAFALPIVDGDHPLISGGAFGGQDGVMFLAAVVGTPATVDVVIPAGTALFVPVINAECSLIEPAPYHGDDEAELRDCANEHIDNTSGWYAEIDGKSVKHLEAYRVESPLFEFGPLPEDNLLAFFGVDAPAGATSPAVDAGVYLLLAPPSVGKHVVRVRATFDEFGASIDTTFNIKVIPHRR